MSGSSAVCRNSTRLMFVIVITSFRCTNRNARYEIFAFQFVAFRTARKLVLKYFIEPMLQNSILTVPINWILKNNRLMS